MDRKRKIIQKKNTPDVRFVRGKARESASFPVSRLEKIPSSYLQTFRELKERIARERIKAVMRANSAMIFLYYDIGTIILNRQTTEGWGARVIDRLSADLRKAFPDMKGFSSRNLEYMRAFATAWPDRSIVQELLAQITWYHNIALLERLDDVKTRLWYAKKALEFGWSHSVLSLQIDTHAHRRHAQAANNFSKTLPPPHSDMATQAFKDPYIFDFLGTADPRREKEVEQALIDHIQRFLLEIGAGFAFVGRQVHLEIGDNDFYIDLLFYHLKLRCYVVIELKAVPFEASFLGKLNFYLSAVDDLLRHPGDKPTIGLLLCKSKNKVLVDYALRGFSRPIGISNWETKLVKTLPKELKGSLPSIEELETELLEKDKRTNNELPRSRASRYLKSPLLFVPSPYVERGKTKSGVRRKPQQAAGN